MSDEDAFQIVDRDHDGQYCPKHVWRERYKDVEDLGIRKLSGRKVVETRTLQRNLQHSRKTW
jgi:hypothetical protein